MKIFWIFLALFNITLWGNIGWKEYQLKKYLQKRDQETIAQLKYWTEQLECVHIFGYGTLNFNACQDRVADQFGRRPEWEAEKKTLEKKVDAMMETP